MKRADCRFLTGLSGSGTVRFSGVTYDRANRATEVAVDVKVELLLELADALRRSPTSPGHAVWHLDGFGSAVPANPKDRTPRPFARCSTCARVSPVQR